MHLFYPYFFFFFIVECQINYSNNCIMITWSYGHWGNYVCTGNLIQCILPGGEFRADFSSLRYMQGRCQDHKERMGKQL